MTGQEKAKRWILSKCSEAGESVAITLSKTDLPSGVTMKDVERAFGKLKRDGRVSGWVMESDNAGCSMRLKCLE